jgi:NAD(P)-dependent dehydrogenase (short-subunit alcohol dehydrogenase family)
LRPALKPLSEQVIVITGASSGIGLATARAAARAGAKVMLAARNEAVLRETEQAILESGGMASYAVTDVTRREDIEALADATVEAYGRFDTWVNDAGLGIFGKLADISEEDHRQLFETNFWGLVNGSLVAAEIMSSLNKILPGFVDWFGSTFVPGQSVKQGPSGRDNSGNLYTAGNGGETAGESEHLAMRSAYTKTAMHPFLTGALAATAVVAAATLLSRNNRS